MKKTNWISTNDKLPEDGDEIIAVDLNMKPYYCIYDKEFDEWYEITTNGDNDICINYKITYYQYPPK